MSARPSAMCQPYGLRPAGGTAPPATGKLQRLVLQSRSGIAADSFRLAEDFEGIIAGRIGFRRRCAERDLRVEHALEQGIAGYS